MENTADRAGAPPGRPARRLPRLRRALRLAGWNASLLAAGLALIGLAGEAWFRLTTRFVERHMARQLVPGVGVIGTPGTEVRWTNGLDFWTRSRTNSQGFLDREPIDPERAAASCHVAVIGDSFVEAKEVAVADKFHVRLEALAARDLPHLDVTTSAFGVGGTGQIAQLPFYDEYARHLHPKLLVLVVYINDFHDNSTILSALHTGWDPERAPFVTAWKNEDGKIELRPPHPDWMAFRTAQFTSIPESTVRALNLGTAWNRLRGSSFFVNWLYVRLRPLFLVRLDSGLAERAESFRRRPRYARLLDGWSPWKPESSIWVTWRLGALEGTPEDPKAVRAVGLPPYSRDALEMTAFALDQFKARADRDGAAVVVLATYRMGARGHTRFDGLRTMAAARGFPVVSQYDYIVRQGGRIEDARWPHDPHWNPTGHRWAAEALLEWLRAHQHVCEPRAS